jgi:hypothetical protein
MFVAANKEQVETRLPEDERCKVHAKLREMWRILDPKAKEPFEAEAKRAEHKYHQDWLEYERLVRDQSDFGHAAHSAHAAHHAHHAAAAAASGASGVHHPMHHHQHSLPPPPTSNMMVAGAMGPSAPIAPPIPTQFYPTTTQWLYKNQGKWEVFGINESATLTSAIREWDARGRQPSHIQIQLMGHPCVVDLVNMALTVGDAAGTRKDLRGRVAASPQIKSSHHVPHLSPISTINFRRSQDESLSKSNIASSAQTKRRHRGSGWERGLFADFFFNSSSFFYFIFIVDGIINFM